MRRAGFTLAEFAVALTIFSVLGLAAGGLLHAAARSSGTADHWERLLWWTTAVADSVIAGGLPGSGSRTLPDGSTVRWASGGSVTAIPAGEDSAWLSLPLPPAEPLPGLPDR